MNISYCLLCLCIIYNFFLLLCHEKRMFHSNNLLFIYLVRFSFATFLSFFLPPLKVFTEKIKKLYILNTSGKMDFLSIFFIVLLFLWLFFVKQLNISWNKYRRILRISFVIYFKAKFAINDKQKILSQFVKRRNAIFLDDTFLFYLFELLVEVSIYIQCCDRGVLWSIGLINWLMIMLL